VRLLTFTSLVAIAIACAPTQPAPEKAPPQGSFPSADIVLSYRLDKPAGPGPFPAIVLGHGSGRITKDQQSFFADPFVHRGYAVLRYDKRGVGGSGGEYSGVGVTNSDRMFELLAGDMAAGVAFLRRQPDIIASRIALAGISQAGWIIPVAAAKAKPAFMILMSGPTVSVGEENYYSKFAEHGGAALDQAYDELSRYTGPRGFDPVPVLATLDVPGLWLLGTDDESIPVRNTVAILRQLAGNGRPFEFVEYPGANHSLFVRTQGRQVPFWTDVDRWLAALDSRR
jgi:dipeptidyl aminopeptidase/acylaminoacyl peptidase